MSEKGARVGIFFYKYSHYSTKVYQLLDIGHFVSKRSSDPFIWDTIRPVWLTNASIITSAQPIFLDSISLCTQNRYMMEEKISIDSITSRNIPNPESGWTDKIKYPGEVFPLSSVLPEEFKLRRNKGNVTDVICSPNPTCRPDFWLIPPISRSLSRCPPSPGIGRVSLSPCWSSSAWSPWSSWQSR